MDLEKLQYYPMGEENGLICRRLSNGLDYRLNGISFNRRCINVGLKYYADISGHPPHLRSLSQLIQPIIHGDFNDGKPFVPIEVLFELEHHKMHYADTYWHQVSPVQSCCSHNGTARVTCVYTKSLDRNPFWIIKALYQWHFAIDISPEDYIEKPLNS